MKLLAGKTPLHRDDGIVSTRIPGESLADLEVEVFTRFLYSKGRLLDIGCGHGRACKYLQRAGFDALGVEVDSDTLRDVKQMNDGFGDGPDFILADGRRQPFRSESFDNAICLASTLSEKHRIWMGKGDRASLIQEGIRILKPGGLMITNFVHRYWNLTGFFLFFRNYWMWLAEKMAGKRTELGDYVETIGRTPIRFHAFTVGEARALFPKESVRLEVWRRGSGLFSDWFFVVAKKVER